MKKVHPDPLTISPVDPMDYRLVDGEWVYDPGWWKEIAKRPKGQKKKRKGTGKRA